MRPLVAAVLALLLLAAPVAAATLTFSGTASPTRSFSAAFSSSDGFTIDVAVSKPKHATYFFQVQDQNSVWPDVGIYCKGVYSVSAWTCVVPSHAATDWEVTMFPTSGKLGISLEVTTP